jgi:hypothetical protein
MSKGISLYCTAFNFCSLCLQDSGENIRTCTPFLLIFHALAFSLVLFLAILCYMLFMSDSLFLFTKFQLVFSSSATVYGWPKEVPCTEEFPLCAVNPYGRTKVLCSYRYVFIIIKLDLEDLNFVFVDLWVLFNPPPPFFPV